MKRLAVLLLGLVLAAPAIAPAWAAGPAGPSVTIYELFGRDSITDRVARLLQPGLAAAPETVGVAATAR